MRRRFAAIAGAGAVAKTLPVEAERGSFWSVRPAYQLVAALLLVGIGIVIGQQIGPAPSEEPPAAVTELRSEIREMREVLSLLQQQSASERLRGVSWSNQIPQPGSAILTALLDAVKHDPSVNVRVASVGALEKFGRQAMVRQGLLEALSEQDSPVVQAALIDVVVALRQTESVEILQKMADSTAVHESVRRQALWAVKQLS
jgi:hypothetical protein